MRERTRTLAVPGRRPILGAALTLAAGTLVLLSSCGGDAKPPADGNTPPVDSSTGIAAPAPATGPKRAAGEYGANDVAFGGAGTALDSLASGWAGCPAPLTGALANGALDPSLGGFKPSLLSGEFTLSGFGFMATQPCPGSGQTGSPARAFESRWLHSSGVALQVNQRENATAVPNTLTPAMARFSANGFEYDLSVLYNPAFVDTTTVTPPDRPATGSGSGTSSGSGGSASTLPAPAPPTAVNTAPILQAAIAQLAPGLSAGCFYREERGDWGDLAAMGIGDPRPAVPSGYSEMQKEIVRLVQPDAGCATPAPEGWPAARVSIHWGNGQRMLSVDITSLQVPAPGAGRFGQGNASWTNGTHQFYLSWDLTVGDAAARALATALDPRFANACTVETRELTAAEFAALGVRVPAAPAGYRSENGLQPAALATSPSAGCGAGGATGYVARWMFFEANAGLVIEAAAFSGPRPPEFSYIPNFEGQTLYWKDAQGREYYVAGYKGGFSQRRAELIAVAKSMDPSFDEKNLLPLPAQPGDPIAVPAGTGRTPG